MIERISGTSDVVTMGKEDFNILSEVQIKSEEKSRKEWHMLAYVIFL